MDVKGRFFIFFFFLFSVGTLVSSSALDLLKSKLNENGSGSITSDISERIQDEMFRNCPEMVPPSREEWIEIIQGAQDGTPLKPRYLQEETFTLHANQSGEFTNTLGENGHWRSKSSMTYHIGLEQIIISTLSIDSMSVSVGALETVTGTMTEQVQTLTSETLYFYGSTTNKITFSVEGGAYKPVEEVLEFTAGEVSKIDENTEAFASSAIGSVDAEGSSIIISANSLGRTVIDGEQSNLEGAFSSISIPMNNGMKNSKDPMVLAKALRSSVGNATVTGTEGTLIGAFTIGKEGEYSTGSESLTMDLKTSFGFNTTTGESGFYWQVNSEDIDHNVLRKGLLASIIDSFFL